MTAKWRTRTGWLRMERAREYCLRQMSRTLNFLMGAWWTTRTRWWDLPFMWRTIRWQRCRVAARRPSRQKSQPSNDHTYKLSSNKSHEPLNQFWRLYLIPYVLLTETHPPYQLSYLLLKQWSQVQLHNRHALLHKFLTTTQLMLLGHG